MSNVTLTIAGRRYTIACAAGEEQHIEKLGTSIDAKLSATPGMAGQSEARTLLYAALLLADELHEANSAPAPTAEPSQPALQLAEPLEIMADRLESIASRLETGHGNA